MCSDTCQTLLGTFPTTLLMIMIIFVHYFAIFGFWWSRFGLGQDPPPLRGRGGHRDRLTVTNLSDSQSMINVIHFLGDHLQA